MKVQLPDAYSDEDSPPTYSAPPANAALSVMFVRPDKTPSDSLSIYTPPPFEAALFPVILVSFMRSVALDVMNIAPPLPKAVFPANDVPLLVITVDPNAWIAAPSVAWLSEKLTPFKFTTAPSSTPSAPPIIEAEQ